MSVRGEAPVREAAPGAGPAGRAWRPRPAVRKTLVLVHVVASVALAGSVWGLVLLNLTATLTTDAALVEPAYRLVTVLVFGGGIPLSFISLASGIALGLGSRWGVLRHWWVFAKLLLLVTTILFGALLGQPEAMAGAVADGTLPSAARRWREVAVVAAQLAMLLTATGLSVFKPRGRVRWPRPRMRERRA
ncbi:hypothetical protein [Actinomadura sp. WMMB 499]|uniref:hypothetical protein n=1 Tax=Actinomadura sp. WMMB 499 TaxID=1219491 RepID=UPI001248E8CB|nr:hypothetical protein [Actinomadura sp. WMMB 499]QFG26561.1 hypothetical protein F7P10_40910 [Actinomadura sp. WMMB 499]